MELTANENKLSQYFDLPAFGMTKRLEQSAPEDKLWKTCIDLVQPNFVFGIELEVENIREQMNQPKYYNYWSATNDASLRNNGIEFVSNPMKAFQIEKALRQIKELNPNYEPVFSERTSTHVHMNARDLTLNQILALTLVYASVEKLLYNWVGHNRDKNIFCVPLYNTNYLQYFSAIVEHPDNLQFTWMKYAGYNLLPLRSKGTVEFRHLYGTWDTETILQWINFLSCMKLYVKQNNLESIYDAISQLNTDSTYVSYIQGIFKKHTDALVKDVNNLQDLLEDTVTMCKMSCVKLKPMPPEAFGKLAYRNEYITARDIAAINRTAQPLQATRFEPVEAHEVITEEVAGAVEEPVQETPQLAQMVFRMPLSGLNVQIPAIFAPTIDRSVAYNNNYAGIVSWIRRAYEENRISIRERNRIEVAWREYLTSRGYN